VKEREGTEAFYGAFGARSSGSSACMTRRASEFGYFATMEDLEMTETVLGALETALGAQSNERGVLETGYVERNAVCAQKLARTRRLTMLPNLTFVRDPIPMKTDICGFKAVCCSMSSFNLAKGYSEEFDSVLKGWVSVGIGLESKSGTQRVFNLLLETLSTYAFAVNHDAAPLYEKVKTFLSHLTLSIDNQNLVLGVANLLNQVIGYFSALLCSDCDPKQRLYFKNNTLLIDEGLCTRMGGSLLETLSRLQLFLVDTRNEQAIMETLFVLCHNAIPPLKKSRFPRQSHSGCLQMRSDYQSLKGLATSILRSNSSRFGAMVGCTSARDCGMLLCEETFQGGSYSLDKLRHNLHEGLSRYCKDPICNARSLKDYANYFFSADPLHFTTGDQVSNKVVRSPFVTKVNLSSLGCRGFFSSFACRIYEDVTFARTHVVALIITGSVLVAIFGLVAVIFYIRWRRRRLDTKKSN